MDVRVINESGSTDHQISLPATLSSIFEPTEPLVKEKKKVNPKEKAADQLLSLRDINIWSFARKTLSKGASSKQSRTSGSSL
ncbi:hypothetical protein POTOM_051317 [Populus tomentosa]|uniref:Uncharacterized protein n=1 Tax=Populus tomentosa TaxID=118781 RepID=A0A8X8C850_POPTO|nr:hypothetical protein POTOM_051317 [Populus tomentosa]